MRQRIHVRKQSGRLYDTAEVVFILEAAICPLANLAFPFWTQTKWLLFSAEWSLPL